MSTPKTVQPINLPAPVGGADFVSPLSEMDDTTSPWLENVDCENRSIKVRRGWVRHCQVSSDSQEYIAALGSWGTRASSSVHNLYAYTVNNIGTSFVKIYDVTSDTASLEHTAADDTARMASAVKAAKRLYFLADLDPGDCSLVYDGATWAVSGFTTGGSPATGDIGTSYRNRIYFISSLSGATLYYSAVDAVTGAVGSFDLSAVFKDAATAAWMTTLSSPGERATETYLVIGSTSGEILVYAGAYPADATWSLVGQFRTSAVLGRNAIIKYNNDTLLITETGLVSLKQVLQQGSAASFQDTLSLAIDGYWRRLVSNIYSNNVGLWNAPGQGASGCYWPEENKVMIFMPGYLDFDGNFSTNAVTIFSYNLATKAWSWHKISNIDVSFTSSVKTGGITYYYDNVYFFVNRTVMKYSPTLYKDEAYSTADSFSAYDFAIHGAYNNFGSKNSNKRIHGYEPIIKTDFGGSNFGIKAASDFGRQVSNRTDVGVLDGYNIPYYSVGAEGTYLQYRLEGSSDTASTDGLEFFGVGALIEPGGLR